MPTYSEDRAWSDKYIPEMKRIIGPYLLIESTDEIDRKQAADLIILTGRNLTIACRLRRAEYAERYPYDITIRSRRSNGVKTEFEKIVDGYGDMMFYGFASSDGTSIQRWSLVDLTALRAYLIREGWRAEGRNKPWSERKNPDGTTSFAAFDLRGLPGYVIVGSSHTIPRCLAAECSQIQVQGTGQVATRTVKEIAA